MYKNFSRTEDKWLGAVLLIALNFWAKFNVCQLSQSTSKTLTSWSFSRYYRRRLHESAPSFQEAYGSHTLWSHKLWTENLNSYDSELSCTDEDIKPPDETKQNPHKSLLHVTWKASYTLMIKSDSNHCFFTLQDPECSLRDYWYIVSSQRFLLWNSCTFRALWNSHRIYTHLCLNAYPWLLFMKNKTWLTDNGLISLLTVSNCIRCIKLLPVFFKLGCLWSVL